MLTFRRFLYRRWLLGVVVAAALLFGLAMLHPYPRQSLFGPTIRGEPWCVWETASRNRAREHEPDRSLFEKAQGWLSMHLNPVELEEVLDDQDFLPLVVHLADDPDETVRWTVLNWLHRFKNLRHPSAIPILKTRLEDDYPDNRIEAAFALWEISKDKQAVDVMVSEINDTSQPRAYVMRTFVENVCKECPEYSIHLLPLANDSDPFIRRFAMFGMYHRGKEAVPVLVKGLQDSDAKVRAAAAASQWSLGPEAMPAVPALVQRLGDSDMQVRRSAVSALKKIEPERFQHLQTEQEID